MRYLLMASLIIVGVIHLLPVVGAAGPERLHALYGVALTDPSLVLLMRHRAILFGILGSYFLLAAFVPSLQLSALIIALLSVVSFLGLAALGGSVSPSISRVVTVDWVALAAIVLGFVAYARQQRQP